jgi:hypothetical protein
LGQQEDSKTLKGTFEARLKVVSKFNHNDNIETATHTLDSSCLRGLCSDMMDEEKKRSQKASYGRLED